MREVLCERITSCYSVLDIGEKGWMEMNEVKVVMVYLEGALRVARRGFQGQELFGEAEGCDKIRSLSRVGWRN